MLGWAPVKMWLVHFTNVNGRTHVALCVSSLSLPDLSHIPQNIFKARNKKKPQCMKASFTNRSSQGHNDPPTPPSLYQSWVQFWSPTDTPGIEGLDRKTALLSTKVCVLLCWRCFPHSVKAYKAFLLHTLLANCIKAFGDSCLSLGVCTSIKRGELRHVEARARHHLSSGERCSNTGARRVWRWHLFVCTVLTNTGWQGTHEFSMDRPPSYARNEIHFMALVCLTWVCIPAKCLKMNDTNTYLFILNQKFLKQAKSVAQKPAEFFKC